MTVGYLLSSEGEEVLALCGPLSSRGLKSPVLESCGAEPPWLDRPTFVFFSGFFHDTVAYCLGVARLTVATANATEKLRDITLSGGSLGSCVDEERSQLRELM